MSEFIFVIGSGRSGTSLAAQVLSKLGGRISDELVPVGEQNPDGAYEDKFVFDTISKLMRELGASHNLPMPQGWLETPAARTCVNALVKKVNDEMQRDGGPWVLKEPRSALLIPLWRKVFNRTKVAPRYVLALRDPVSVCVSSLKQYDQSVDVTELMWLNKNVSALSELGGSGYLLHYESWFSSPVETARGLVEFVGLQVEESSIQAVVDEVVKPRLNRSEFLDVELKNPYVLSLYQALKECSGLDYGRDRLKSALKEATEAMAAFSGWVKLYHAKRSQVDPVEAGQKNRDKLVEQTKNDLAQALSRESELLRKLEHKKDNEKKLELVAKKLIESNRAAEETERRLEKSLTDARNKLSATRQSYSYKLGWTIVSAIKKPGINTLKAPFRLIKVVFMLLRGRRSV